MKSTGKFILNNGVKIPAVGFGTWQVPNGRTCYDSVSYALECGYRHIDTALAYGNEESVGKAVRDSGLDRREVFITTKLPAEVKDHRRTLKSFDLSMRNLGLEYIDLYLIHAPWPWGRMGDDFTRENIEVWKAMEKIYNNGNCRAIGVSNFNVSDLTAIMDTSNTLPAANQIEFYIGHTQEEITSFCQDSNILVEGYSPLATGNILNNEKISQIARKYNVSVPQICIRYVLQREVLPLPKSVHEEYIKQNLDLDFTISEDDMTYLGSLKLARVTY